MRVFTFFWTETDELYGAQLDEATFRQQKSTQWPEGLGIWPLRWQMTCYRTWPVQTLCGSIPSQFSASQLPVLPLFPLPHAVDPVGYGDKPLLSHACLKRPNNVGTQIHLGYCRLAALLNIDHTRKYLEWPLTPFGFRSIAKPDTHTHTHGQTRSRAC